MTFLASIKYSQHEQAPLDSTTVATLVEKEPRECVAYVLEQNIDLTVFFEAVRRHPVLQAKFANPTYQTVSPPPLKPLLQTCRNQIQRGRVAAAIELMLQWSISYERGNTVAGIEGLELDPLLSSPEELEQGLVLVDRDLWLAAKNRNWRTLQSRALRSPNNPSPLCQHLIGFLLCMGYSNVIRRIIHRLIRTNEWTKTRVFLNGIISTIARNPRLAIGMDPLVTQSDITAWATALDTFNRTSNTPPLLLGDLLNVLSISTDAAVFSSAD
ncbi:MAG: hypothetical protein RL235_269 [Chlamydiota bacterium]|jgi:hypothetical protein